MPAAAAAQAPERPPTPGKRVKPRVRPPTPSPHAPIVSVAALAARRPAEHRAPAAARLDGRWRSRSVLEMHDHAEIQGKNAGCRRDGAIACVPARGRFQADVLLPPPASRVAWAWRGGPSSRAGRGVRAERIESFREAIDPIRARQRNGSPFGNPLVARLRAWRPRSRPGRRRHPQRHPGRRAERCGVVTRRGRARGEEPRPRRGGAELAGRSSALARTRRSTIAARPAARAFAAARPCASDRASPACAGPKTPRRAREGLERRAGAASGGEKGRRKRKRAEGAASEAGEAGGGGAEAEDRKEWRW